ncbi:MAG: peptidase, partial [Firmicutes bacterium]|nr:peptidase [Bacillota bacterium]
LDGIVTDGVRIEGRLLPVSIAAMTPAAIALAAELEGEDAVVVATGLAAGRSGLAVERVAINCADFSTPDNDGQTRSGEPLEDSGIAAYFTTLPLQPIVAAWQDAGLSGYISNSAGTYICNAWFYLLRAHLPDTQPCGFIHVPCTPDMVRQSQKPSMSFGDIRLGIELAVRTSLRTLRERAVPPSA